MLCFHFTRCHLLWIDQRALRLTKLTNFYWSLLKRIAQCSSKWKQIEFSFHWLRHLGEIRNSNDLLCSGEYTIHYPFQDSIQFIGNTLCLHCLYLNPEGATVTASVADYHRWPLVRKTAALSKVHRYTGAFEVSYGSLNGPDLNDVNYYLIRITYDSFIISGKFPISFDPIDFVSVFHLHFQQREILWWKSWFLHANVSALSVYDSTLFQ